MDKVDPKEVLASLKENSGKRTSKSLDLLYSVLEKQSKQSTKDFSIVTIGKLSEQAGGPSTQTIRNKTGLHYQTLISAWADWSNVTMKKPLMHKSRQAETNDMDILKNITEPVLRALVGTILAERNKYRNQLNTLKQHANVTIDTRKHSQNEGSTINLNQMEFSALQEAVSDDFFNRMNWLFTPAGQVKSQEGIEIYKHGYVNAIKKVVEHCSGMNLE